MEERKCEICGMTFPGDFVKGNIIISGEGDAQGNGPVKMTLSVIAQHEDGELAQVCGFCLNATVDFLNRKIQEVLTKRTLGMITKDVDVVDDMEVEGHA